VAAASSTQHATALSTYESELSAVVLGARMVMAQRILARDIIGKTLPMTIIHCDNMSVIAQLTSRDLTGRTRHINTYLGFLFDAIDNKEIDVKHIRTKLNPANTLTVAENRDRFAASAAVISGQR
jgi:hypothetical protein